MAQERYTRGALTLDEYEAELERLLALARRAHVLEGIDAAREPSPRA